jgi:transcriptional regulator with XRE-family HTH domain
MLGLMTKKSSNRIDKYIGSRIRVRRHTLGISQRKLAHALGLSFQQIQRYENGTDRIGAGRLQQLSQVLQAPAAFFFQGAPNISVGGSREPKIESPVRLMRFLSTREGTALVRAFMRLDMKLRWRIVNLVQTLADFGR